VMGQDMETTKEIVGKKLGRKSSKAKSSPKPTIHILSPEKYCEVVKEKFIKVIESHPSGIESGALWTIVCEELEAIVNSLVTNEIVVRFERDGAEFYSLNCLDNTKGVVNG